MNYTKTFSSIKNKITNYFFSNFLKLFLKNNNNNKLKIIQIGFESSFKLKEEEEEEKELNFKLLNPFYEYFLKDEIKNKKDEDELIIIKNVCNIIYNKDIIEKKEISNERLNILKNELEFYEIIQSNILTENKNKIKEFKIIDLFKSLLKELEIISKNWTELNKIEILKFLKFRIELTKESLNLEKLNLKKLKIKSKILIIEKQKEFKINQFYKFKELNHKIIGRKYIYFNFLILLL